MKHIWSPLLISSHSTRVCTIHNYFCSLSKRENSKHSIHRPHQRKIHQQKTAAVFPIVVCFSVKCWWAIDIFTLALPYRSSSSRVLNIVRVKHFSRVTRWDPSDRISFDSHHPWSCQPGYRVCLVRKTLVIWCRSAAPRTSCAISNLGRRAMCCLSVRNAFLFVCGFIWLVASGPHFASADINDPYQILGLTRKATLPDIRKAYKKLAKEW